MKNTIIKKCIATLLVSTCLFIPVDINAVESVKTDLSKKIDGHLLEKLNGMKDTDKVDVSIWTKDISDSQVDETITSVLAQKSYTVSKASPITQEKYDEIKNLDFSTDTKKADTITSEEIDEFVMLERAAKSALYVEHNEKFCEEIIGEVSDNIFSTSAEKYEPQLLFSSKYAPNVEMNLTKQEIFEIVNNEQVTDVFESVNNCNEVDYDTYNDSDSVMPLESDTENYDKWYFEVTGVAKLRDEYGLDGTGVKIGTIESFVPDIEIDCLKNMDLTNRPYDNEHHLSGSPVDGSGGHMNYTTSIMAGKTDTYTGGIPKAKFYSASAYSTHPQSPGFKGAFEWVISQGVSVITSSSPLGNDEKGYYGDSAKWLDHIMSEHNIIFTMAGPYADAKVGSGGMSYNTVLVGRSTIDNKIASGGLFEDTDHYKPDIVAPGSYIGTPLGVAGGTSAAAPIVACAAVQLIQKYPELKTHPMMTKALLLNGTKYFGEENVANSTDQISGFARGSGAGILNVENSMLPLMSREATLHTLKNEDNTYNDFALVSKSNVDNKLQLRITECCVKENTVGGIHTDDFADVTNSDISAFKITVTHRSSGDKWCSYFSFDNKTAVCFTPMKRGYYDIEVTRITGLEKTARSYLVVSRH